MIMNKIKDMHNNESIEVSSPSSERKEHSTDFLSYVFPHNSVIFFFPFSQQKQTQQAAAVNHVEEHLLPAVYRNDFPYFRFLRLRNKLSFWSFPNVRFFFNLSLFYSLSFSRSRLILSRFGSLQKKKHYGHRNLQPLHFLKPMRHHLLPKQHIFKDSNFSIFKYSLIT